MENMQSESIKHIALALQEFQSEMTIVSKNKAGHGYRYADLAEIVRIFAPILKKCELTYTHQISGNSNELMVYTKLIHSASGEWLMTCVPGSVIENAIWGYSKKTGEREITSRAIQVAGTIITYARRYGLAGILGIVIDEDTDGMPVAATEEERVEIKKEAVQKKQSEKEKAAVDYIDKFINEYNSDDTIAAKLGGLFEKAAFNAMFVTDNLGKISLSEGAKENISRTANFIVNKRK